MSSEQEVERLTRDWVRNLRSMMLIRTGVTMDPAAARKVARTIALSLIEAEGERKALAESARRRLATQDDICAMVKVGHTKAEAAEHVGVSRQTVGQWARTDRTFAARLAAASAEGGSHRTQRLAVRLPRKMTAEVRSRVISMLAQGRSRAETLESAGISKQTFYTWLQRAPEFRRAVLAAEHR